jgi:hypothetical protein
VKFRLEKIDVAKLKSLYHLRGYKKEEDDNYCTSMALLGRANNTGEDEYEITLFLSKKTLTEKDGKELLKYLKSTGMKLTAKVLKADADRFYNTRAFKRISI